MYGSAFDWEWFAEIVPHYELFPEIDYSDEVYNVHWFHIHVVINRKKHGKSIDSSGGS